MPEMGLRLGKPTGAAMPLVWAHAEYVKLLRSVTDGKVFDQLSVVAERYGRGKRPSRIEIFRFNRQVQAIPAGSKLRIVADEHFYLVWTVDDWKTVRTMDSKHLGCGIHFADVDTEPGKTGKVIFTMRWILANRWEGRNLEVRLDPVHQEQETAVDEETVALHATS
jgi:glucoamylase